MARSLDKRYSFSNYEASCQPLDCQLRHKPLEADPRIALSAAFIILIVLIYAAPIATFVDGNVATGIEAMTVAVAIVLVVRKLPRTETEPGLSRLIFRASAIPALVMIIQVLPLGYVVANPIWESTQQALGHAIVGSIGIDTGAGLIGLIQYTSAIAIVFITMAVTRDRSRADGTLFALMIAATIICLPVAEVLSQPGIVTDTWSGVGAIRDVGTLGVLLAVTAATRAFERFQSSRGASRSQLIRSLAVSSATLAFCGAALATRWNSNLEFCLAFSLTVLLAMMAIRRLEIGVWGVAAIAAVILTVSVSIVWIQYGHRAADLMTAYSDNDRLVAMTQRMLADTPWLGNGAGSFQMLANIYRQPLDVMPVMKAPTAAAKIAIELGRPVLWIMVAATVLAIIVMLRGALRRGRDSFYPTLGAGCLAALLIRGFADASMFAQAVSIVAAATVGLALAQTSGRTTS